MKNFQDELAKVLAISDEKACIKAFVKLIRQMSNHLPLPGQNPLFDKVMWQASEHMMLSKKDEAILKQVVSRMLGETSLVANPTYLNLRDLIGATRQAAIQSWQEMLSAMSWHQMVPAGALRGVGGQLVSLGTISKEIADASVQLNLGWLVDQDNLRILLQAKDKNLKALPDVELKVCEIKRGVVFSRKTNADGAIVAPAVSVGPGQYQIQVSWMDELVETPSFMI